MKIGFISCDLNGRHGGSRYSLQLIQELHRLGVEVAVVTTADSSTIFPFTTYAILPSIDQPHQLMRLFACIPQTAKLLSDCDLIHVTAENYSPLGAAIAGKRPLFVSGIGTYVQLPVMRKPPVRWLFRWAFSSVDQFVCISRYTEKVLQNVLPNANSTVIPLAVDNEKFATLTHLPQNTPTILTVGAVKPRKGVLQLIQSVQVVREQIPNIRCVVIGSLNQMTSYVDEIRSFIKFHQMQDNVLLLGHISEEELLHWYQTADLYVQPSLNSGYHFEGFGLVYLEASAAGLPVIGTFDCGAEDAIQNNVTGLLVRQSQLDKELPQAIYKLLANPQLRIQMGTAGRAFAQARTWADVAHKMRSCYEQVLT